MGLNILWIDVSPAVIKGAIMDDEIIGDKDIYEQLVRIVEGKEK